ncbi:hypothetical protein CEQ90_20080 [Lewinellaceae bacterium SD302]|nr:hypothetical protein CEQ90_20080 [Lewinellaceae bacterium SD302]
MFKGNQVKNKIMKELAIEDKQKFLQENYPFEDPPNLTDKRRCIHCDTVFYVGDFKVFKDNTGNELICCPKAPDCNGTVIDWFRLL